MAITAAICNSYKQEILQGVHLNADTYMIALFTSSATLSKATTAYSATGEVANGNGYATGGLALSGFSTGLDVDTAYLDWTTDPSWPAATITARGALIYNASKGNKAVAVLDFGADKTSTSGTFLVTLPAPAAATALLRIA
jgi:hypothetical protein